MIELTSRQSEVLDAIVLYKDRTGFPPTMLELAALIGCSSPNAAAEHVKAIQRKGYLSIAPGVARGITVVKTELDDDPVAIIKGLLSGGDMSRDNAVEWLKKQGVTL
ncbi:LexA family transcriptional regulator [Enterobacter kobei]|uniref:LexA family transcriptional regulator n=1 Tax=Enterobacter kobei TaxID=208224 RepID=A0AAJ6LP21_9ENTR|nr:LexA family transcriptional regulator [Enterobacter kobei]MCM7065770.1 LexA family transcriptional regulator [Enterobacter kobei]WMT67625.1 LexA family transcriptional regulator [Enterobacter kobei]